MADSQTTIALNIGSQCISAAVFETSKSGGLVLKGYDSENIEADPALEASRQNQVESAINDIVGRLKISKSKVRYTISGQSVFTRFVKLPPIQDDNIDQLVTFEAQQHVPFPINEVVWDYELIEGGEEKEVVIVAIKGDALDEINDTVTKIGLQTVEVDVAPMALYNAFRSAYGAPEEPTLLIDVGAKTSNLLYIEGKQFFTRSVAIGGSSVTSAIAKEYGISFQEAENQKIVNGLVALGGGHTENLDESVAALAMTIRNALTRLPAEIARTTNYFRSQHGGSAPKRVYLAGGGANLPYTLEFFHEKLNLPVEFFNPLSHVAIGKGMDTEQLQSVGHTMGELVGLGLRGIGKSTINIDLVPSAVEETRASNKRKPFLIAAAAVLVFGFLLWAIFSNLAASKALDKNRRMAEMEQQLSPIERGISGLLKKEEDLKSKANAYTEIEADHAYWFDLLGEIGGAFASDSVWITKMVPLYKYDSNPEEGQKGELNPAVELKVTGQSSTGSSIKSAPTVQAPENDKKSKRKKKNEVVEIPALAANAIVVEGFWRENPKSQGVVSELLASLRENSRVFDFTVPGKEGETLSDEQILTISAVGEEGDLGFPFRLVLPLARPVTLK
ncbi:Amuc_1101 family PilM-like pilus complex protein [Luteolibacter sp. AS25]|uniref:Amuc_1101 family PilM-like pilus complex protein n=1 Tax=Luteolibacter sp. AS25 TaxID=3135776 RepID=UPI00398BAFFB